jgi:hypothetical protein
MFKVSNRLWSLVWMCCNGSIYIDLIVEPNILVDLILTLILNLRVWRTTCFKNNTNVVLMIKHATCWSRETKKTQHSTFFCIYLFLYMLFWVRGKFCDHFRSQRNLLASYQNHDIEISRAQLHLPYIYLYLT